MCALGILMLCTDRCGNSDDHSLSDDLSFPLAMSLHPSLPTSPGWCAQCTMSFHCGCRLQILWPLRAPVWHQLCWSGYQHNLPVSDLKLHFFYGCPFSNGNSTFTGLLTKMLLGVVGICQLGSLLCYDRSWNVKYSYRMQRLRTERLNCQFWC